MVAHFPNGTEVPVELQTESAVIHGAYLSYDIQHIDANRYHLILDGRSYNAELLDYDLRERAFTWSINGSKVELRMEDEFDLLLKSMGIDKDSANKIDEIKAPMPGLVLEVLVKEGDEIKEGDPLLILEAMKMENVIKSPCDALVSEIPVSVQQKIDKNAVLVRFS